MSVPIALETERLLLREVTVDDVTDRYVSWLNDDEVTRYLEARFSDNSAESLKAYVRDQSADSAVVFVAIVEKPDSLIGTIKLGPIDYHHMRGDVGIMIGEREAWGQGYATEAIRALSTFAFDHLGLVRLSAGAYAVNTGSIKAFERAGFQVEGVLRDEVRLGNGRADIVQLGRLRPAREAEDWRPDSDRVREVLETSLGRAGLQATLRSADAPSWDAAWQSLPYQPVAYSSPMLDYQHAYMRGAGCLFDDISLVIHKGTQVCGLWPLAVGGHPGDLRLTSSGGSVFGPAFGRDVADRTRKNLCARAVALVRELCSGLHLPPPRLTQHVSLEPDLPGATWWHQQLMASGAAPFVRHELFVDLSRPLAEIRASFRKSYRSLVNAGLRDWIWQLHSDADPSPDAWDEFRQLHRSAAGRTTRGDETWAKQSEMIEHGDAFLVCLRDPANGRLVSGGFFQTTRDEALYSVAANDRSLSDQPLGHAVQQVAIEHMKSRGQRWYCIGQHPYSQDTPEPTVKELKIADFKRGFASHVVCRHEFELPLPAE